ncbi:MAG TPA: (2Fe-2S)-binding protein [Gammaproteobacteria bacterium]
MYICICKAVTEDQVHRVIDQGAARLRDLQIQLGVATQCGACAGCARSILSERTSQNTGVRPVAASLIPVLVNS